jgi:peptidoglycan/LPS O-acetylase OafA/YrhL
MSSTPSETIATEPLDERAPTIASLTYRPHLDGLRAVAVYLVVLFHAGVKRFSGGFIGVDVFFVLSGFLVTQLLLRDLAATGAVRFRYFYARRFRRLLPAAFVALLITAAIFAAISPLEALAAAGAFKAAFLYSANWFFIHQATGYFGADVNSNPVLHFWSLAVEEQFYLLWPLLLTGLFWLTGRHRHAQALAMRAVVATAAVASLAWALSLRVSHPNHAYYGTDARAYQLLAGALIALSPGIVSAAARVGRAARIATIVCVGVLLFLASSFVALDAIERGVAVAFVASLLIVALEAADAGVVKVALSSDPLVYLGKVSYGTYLWHWPVIIVAQRLWGLGSAAIVGVVCLVATGLASVSYQLLERPIRTSTLLERHRGAVIASGLVVSLVSALVFVPAILDPQSPTVATARASETSGFTPVPPSLDWRKTYFEFFGTTTTCVGRPPDACTIVHGTGRRVLLMGDSNAEMMVPTFTKIARSEHLTLSLAVTPGCPWQRGLYRLGVEIKQRCRRNKEDAYRRVIPALRPDLIVLVDSREELDHHPGDPPITSSDRLVRRTTIDSLRHLRAPGRDILIIEPMPQSPPGMNPLTCLSKAKVLEQCRYIANTPPSWLELLERRLASRRDRVWTADFDRLVCPFLPICDPFINGNIVKWDGQHLTTRYAASLAEPVAAYLHDNGLLPR